MSDPYCGIKKIPTGKKRGSMKECAEKGKISYYGIKKVDSKIVELANAPASAKKTESQKLRIKVVGIRGKIKNLSGQIKVVKDKTKKVELEKELKDNEKQLKKTLKELQKEMVKEGQKRLSKKGSKK